MSAIASPSSRLVIILSVALILRCGAGAVLQRRLDRDPTRPLCLILGDAWGYWELGKQLAAGKEYAVYVPPRRAMRMPGFPLLLAGCIRLAGEGNLLAVRLVLAVVGTLACMLVYWLGRELFDHQTALVAAAFAAISPTFIGFSVLILSETLFAAAILATLICFAKLVETSASAESRQRGLLLAGLAGLFVALGTYVRPTWLLAGPLFSLVYVLMAADRAAAALRGALLLAVLVLALAPWTYRNYRVTGRFVPTTLWFGPSLYDGLNPKATGDSDMTFFDTDGYYQQHSEFETDRHYRREAEKFLTAHPVRALQLSLVKAARFWSPWPNAEQFRSPLAHAVLAAFYFPAVLLALLQLAADLAAGRAELRRRAWRILLSLGPIVYFTAVHMVFVGSIRYRLPAAYPALLMSAAGATTLAAWLAGRINGMRPAVTD